MIYTYGYAGRTLDDLSAHVDALSAKVVDVRLRPFSKQREWARDSLQEAFGTGYVWVGDLGNVNYKGQYGPHTMLKNRAAGVQRVSELMKDGPVILLCMCSNPMSCHRTDAADAVAHATGDQINHLGKFQYQNDLFG